MINWRKEGIVYCWDTSVFFALLKAETCHPLQDIDYVSEEITNGTASLLIPATAYEELHYSNLTTEQKAIFDGLTHRPNVMVVDLSPPVARKSAEIIRMSSEEKLTTKLNDARILATAVVMRATVLHSLDTNHTRLSEKPLIDRLTVTPPHVWGGQMGVRYGQS